MATTAAQKIITAEDLASLAVGDAVLATRDGRTHALHVVRIAPPGSMGRSFSSGPRVTVGYGVGRWNFEVDAELIRAGFVVLERG